MTDIRSLERTLIDNLPWNKARIKFAARFLLALYAVRTINLSIPATAFSCHAKEEPGNSATGERTTVMESFLDLFGARAIACLLGDQEFVGREWFRFLKRHRIKSQMRLRKNTLISNGRGQYAHAWGLFCRTRITLSDYHLKPAKCGAWNST